eukprot:40645-Chlamydomonas_euryale.AAC.7
MSYICRTIPACILSLFLCLLRLAGGLRIVMKCAATSLLLLTQPSSAPRFFAIAAAWPTHPHPHPPPLLLELSMLCLVFKRHIRVL